VADRTAHGMRRYWDERAVENALWYIDTSIDFRDPDMTQFLATGRKIANEAFVDAPVRPERRHLAVEIGPGVGRVSLAMAEHFERVIGIDVSAEMVRRARQLVPDERISFEIGDGMTLAPVGDGDADFVFSFTVLQHIPKVSVIERYLAEAARVLAPGGVAALQWNNDPHPLRWKARAVVSAALHRAGAPSRSDNRHARQFYGSRVPVQRITSALERAGLDIVATKGEGTLFAWVWARKPASGARPA
jgi:SAM-dependent methyltransferase